MQLRDIAESDAFKEVESRTRLDEISDENS
jgi:hypothetical protein